MLHNLLIVVAIVIAVPFVITINVLISTMLIGVAHECYKRSQAVSTAITGKSSDQHQYIPGDQV